MEQSQTVKLLDEIAKYAPLLNTFVLAGIAWMINQFSKVNQRLAHLNGRLGKVEVDTQNIKDVGDERHHDNCRTLERLESRVGSSCKFPECPPGKRLFYEEPKG